MGLGAAHDDAVGPLLDDAHVEVLVLHLLRGPQAAVALDVGEAHGEGQVVLLQVPAIGLDVGGVVGAVLLVDPRRDHGDRVETVLGDELGAGRLAEADPGPQLDHLAQPEQVLARALRLEGEADALAVLVDVGEQVLVARVVVHDVVHGDPVVGDLADGVSGHVVDALAVEVDDPAVFETVYVLLRGLDSHVDPFLRFAGENRCETSYAPVVDRALALHIVSSGAGCVKQRRAHCCANLHLWSDGSVERHYSPKRFCRYAFI